MAVKCIYIFRMINKIKLDVYYSLYLDIGMFGCTQNDTHPLDNSFTYFNLKTSIWGVTSMIRAKYATKIGIYMKDHKP